MVDSPVKKMPPWKILIADDENEVHVVTKMVLSSFTFDHRKVELISAYNSEETKKAFRENPDLALVLLDVVMDEDNTGLKLVKWIRDEHGNSLVRIVLRTGQPGYAPEDEVVQSYDINDYKEKTELTSQKLYTVIYSALRAYRELFNIEKSRRGLAEIVKSSASIFELQSLQRFVKGVLNQLTSLMRLMEDSVYATTSGIAACNIANEFLVVVGTGTFDNLEGKPITEVLQGELHSAFLSASEKKESVFIGNVFVGFFETHQKKQNIILLHSSRSFTEIEKELLLFFNLNISAAFENIYLNKEIEDTQNEVIQTLVEVIESRSKETLNHVKRVGLFSLIMGQKLNLTEKELLILQSASALHDIGKIIIPDNILQKKGSLSEDEFRVVQQHTLTGNEILKRSQLPMMNTAAIIALQHHERWDGSGYPQGISGEEIHLFSRITSLADIFDSLRKQRSYGEKKSFEEIKQFFISERGRFFDPALVDIFIENFEDFKQIEVKYPDH